VKLGLTLTAAGLSLALILAVSHSDGLAAARELSRAEQEVVHQAQQALAGGKDPRQALRIIRNYLKRRPDKPHALVLFTLGLAHHQLDRTAEAAAAYQKALEADPNHRSSRLNLAAAQYALGRPAEAAQSWERAYNQSEEKDPKLLYQAAAAYYQGGNLKDSARLMEPLVSGTVDPPEPWFRLYIQVLLEQGRRREAEAVLAGRLQSKPDMPDLWRLLAQVRFELGRKREAALALGIAYAMDPPGPDEWRNLANLYFHLDSPLAGVRALEKAFGPDPSAEQCRHLALWLARAGRTEEALDWLDQGISKDPIPGLLLAKGRLLFEAGRYGEAVETLNKVETGSEEAGPARLLGGLSALETGSLALARRELESAKRDENQREQAERVLEILARLEAEETAELGRDEEASGRPEAIPLDRAAPRAY
jgi:tetratricopeptide (TPR) repeat protein